VTSIEQDVISVMYEAILFIVIFSFYLY
jgi:hypothetical protein